jgi:hypothetical protein
MVTVSLPPAVTPEFWSHALHLPFDPRAARMARRTLRVVLAEHGMTDLIDPAELLTSELVTNATGTPRGPLRCGYGRWRAGGCG